MSRLLLAVVVLLSLLRTGSADDAPVGPGEAPAGVADKALELERRVLDARRSIASGEADVRVTRSDGREPLHWKLWFEGDRLRMEQVDAAGESFKKIVRVPGRIFHRGMGIKVGSGERILSAPEVHDDDWNGTMLFDLRKLGLVPVPAGVLHSIRGWEYPLADPARERTFIGPAELDGRAVTKIGMRASDGDEARLWIDEDRGPSLVRIEYEAKVDGKVYLDTESVELGEFDGVWFPKRVTHQRSVDGGRFPSETTALENVKLNHDIPDVLFTLESVGVKPGETVNVYPEPPEGPQVWNGSRLVPEKSPRVPIQGTSTSGENEWHPFRAWLVGLNVAAAAALLLAHVIYNYKHKK